MLLENLRNDCPPEGDARNVKGKVVSRKIGITPLGQATLNFF